MGPKKRTSSRKRQRLSENSPVIIPESLGDEVVESGPSTWILPDPLTTCQYLPNSIARTFQFLQSYKTSIALYRAMILITAVDLSFTPPLMVKH
ncbi:hypothetical protein EJ04DRAFT_301527 [Polyplosphaeria fusca]|uniref:Uncharacterized protein n=1 Tax=Polyplosphaeria fusca TaxID=682080 RepID=A0A9P4UZU4_9PLEO|nr:hypothetical protein EJ04DRAFT_301527 [Polyplosphaeria fusca]